MIKRVKKSNGTLVLFSRKNETLKDYVEIIKLYYQDLILEPQSIFIGIKRMNFNPLYSKYVSLVHRYKIGELSKNDFSNLFLEIFKNSNEILFNRAETIVNNLEKNKIIQNDNSLEM